MGAVKGGPGLKQLTKLDLFRTQVTETGLKELREALPTCEIED
jgi:hypothetical protein